MLDSRSDGSTPRHERRLVVGSFVALLAVTGVAFTVTGTGYFAAEQAESDLVTGTVTDYRVEGSADSVEIVVDVEFENPTMRPVAVDSVNVNGLVNDTAVVRGSTSLDETIPAGETETITLRLTPRDEYRSAAVEAAESGSLSVSGIAWARIEEYRFEIGVRPGGGEDA